MLVLTRKNQETVVVGGAEGFESILKVTVLRIKAVPYSWASTWRPRFPSIVWKCGNESTTAVPAATSRREPT